MKTETSKEIMEQIKTYVLLASKRMLTIDEVCLLTGYKKQGSAERQRSLTVFGEVGERMGIGYNPILQWEKGKKGMSVRTLKALCDALEMPLELGGKELRGK